MLYVARPLPQVARRHVPPTTVRTPIVPQAACASLLLTLLRRNRDIAVETRRYLLLLLFLLPFFPLIRLLLAASPANLSVILGHARAFDLIDAGVFTTACANPRTSSS